MTTSAAAAVPAIEPELRALSRPTLAPQPRGDGENGPAQGTDAAGAIFAIDTRPLVRAGLATLARRALGCSAHALNNVDRAAAALRLADSPPRAVLLGLRSGDDPAELLRQARRVGVPVICALDRVDGILARAALAAGADGYVVLDATDARTLQATVVAAEAGECLVPAELERFRAGTSAPVALTDRCLEVLQSLADGLHDDEIANRLGISTSSVRKHIASAQGRLKARTRTQVVAMVAIDGLLVG
jgi:DNA-binding NarL/FixJ family response regulator